MRVALVHDWLTGMRGGERVLEQLAAWFPQAHCHVLFHVPGATSAAIDRLRIHTSPLGRLPGAHRHYRALLPLYPWAVGRLRPRDCDLVLSTSHAVAKSVPVEPGTPHLCYCFTPMRYVWDQADAYLGRGLGRLLAAPLVAGLRRFDVRRSGPERVTRFTAISQVVADRIRRHYGRRARVVHPPVALDRFRPDGLPPDDFFLLVGGFVPYKREALVLEAFRRLGWRLVVAGDGPLRARLEASAPGCVEFVGRVSDAELARLYARCRALVFAAEEDFGLVSLEAQAAGRPVIAYGRGGARESLDEHTGVLFDDPTPEALVAALRGFAAREDELDPAAIRAHAERFGPERFRAEMAEEIEAALAGKG